MKKTPEFMLILLLLFAGGCNYLRMQPTEVQKQDAQMAKDGAYMASVMAKQEAASPELQAVTAVIAKKTATTQQYMGLPKQVIPVASVDDLTGEVSQAIGEEAAEDAKREVEPIVISEALDTVLDIGLALAGVFGVSGLGVWVTKLRNANKIIQDNLLRKDAALGQIVTGNEALLKAKPEIKVDFAAAHHDHSADTRDVVHNIRAANGSGSPPA